MTEISAGGTVIYDPKKGGSFLTGEEYREAYVEVIRDDIIVQQNMGSQTE